MGNGGINFSDGQDSTSYIPLLKKLNKGFICALSENPSIACLWHILDFDLMKLISKVFITSTILKI